MLQFPLQTLFISEFSISFHCKAEINIDAKSTNVKINTISNITSKTTEILDITSQNENENVANTSNTMASQNDTIKSTNTTKKTKTIIKIAAIDNGLAFPCKHPDEWRACKNFFILKQKL